jgi:hypothetical protein
MDSQSVKTTTVGGVRGYDGGKKLSGRKRRLLAGTPWVTLGLVLKAKVHAANVQDRAAVLQVLTSVKERFGRLAHIWLDQGTTGSGKTWIETELGWTVEIVLHAPTKRGEWRYTRDESGKLLAEYRRCRHGRDRRILVIADVYEVVSHLSAPLCIGVLTLESEPVNPRL